MERIEYRVPVNDFDDYRPGKNLDTVAETKQWIAENFGVMVQAKRRGGDVVFTIKGGIGEVGAFRLLYHV